MTQRRAISTRSEEETLRLGRELGGALRPGAVVELRGPLGAGKTVLARGIAAALGCDPVQVASPSFALVHEYDSPEGPVIHVDGYRLSESGREWEELGIEELAENARAVLIEWPRVDSLRLPGRPMVIEFSIGDDGTRTIEISDSA